MAPNEYLTRCLTKSELTVARKIGDEFILVPIRRKAGEVKSVYALNEVAARIWELIDGKRSVGQVIAAIADEFDVSSEEAEYDVVELLEQLTSIGALQEA